MDFENRQYQINRLITGDNLIHYDDGCKNNHGDVVLKYSKNFIEKIAQLKEQGYHVENAKVNFVVFWKDPEKDKEYKIILPELNFVEGT